MKTCVSWHRTWGKAPLSGTRKYVNKGIKFSRCSQKHWGVLETKASSLGWLPTSPKILAAVYQLGPQHPAVFLARPWGAMQIRPQVDKELFISCHKVPESPESLGFPQNLFTPTFSSITILLPNPCGWENRPAKIKVARAGLYKRSQTRAMCSKQFPG